jgi:acetate kinase
VNDAIIVLNAGSSSLKFSVYSLSGDGLSVVVRGQTEGLGTNPRFKAKGPDGAVLGEAGLDGTAGKVGHAEAFAHLSGWLRERFGAKYAPVGVGHRMVHGGLDFAAPTVIDADVLARLEKLVPLVPLHQPHNLAGVKAVAALRPDLSQVACFDTAFHRGRAAVTERLAIPDEFFRRGVRRWGFHGLSYQSIAGQLPAVAPEIADGRVIVAHLGSGASMCAMKAGRSVDTTMSFSVLDGLPMGTRCGTLDPGVVLYLLGEYSRDEVESMLYRKSGLLGISCVSNDVRELLASPSPLAAEAVEYFVYRCVREIGSLTAALGGLDGLVFTAGIGENSPVIRSRICQCLGWLGIRVDAGANERGKGRISPPGQAPSVWVLATDEEAVIARGTLAAIRASGTVAEASLAH